jgi:hypothetical protein
MSKVEQFDDDIRPEYLDWSGAVKGKFAGRRPAHQITVSIQVMQLAEDRWRARSAQFPDAIGYGPNADSALDQGEDLISQIIGDRVARGEIPPTGLNFAIDYL